MGKTPDLVKDDGGYYNPGDLKPGTDMVKGTVEGWSKDIVKDVQRNQDWGQQMGYDKGSEQARLERKDRGR